MSSFDEIQNECRCSGYRDRPSSAILFNILSRRDSGECVNDSWKHESLDSAPHSCQCPQQRTVCLANPEDTCQVASAVLIKTISFMKNLPSFHQLPPRDQLSLLQSCWAPLFILGLAQDGMAFEVTDVPAASLLRRILLSGQGERVAEAPEAAQPTLVGVHKLKSCLTMFRSMDLSPKEYAYLKGTMLFNPDVPGLRAALFIEGLQHEAQRALREVVLPQHPEDQSRFARILLTASALRAIAPGLVTELFFRPVIGQADLLELLAEILFTR